MGVVDIMPDPLAALLVMALILAVISLVFWPGKGLVARWRQARKRNERILIEDALKHLYDCEYQGLSCTLASLAGALDLRGGRTAAWRDDARVCGRRS